MIRRTFVPSSPSPLSGVDSDNENQPQKTTTPPVNPKPVTNDPDILSSSSKNPNIHDDDHYDYNSQSLNLDDDNDDNDDNFMPPHFFNLLTTFPLFKQAPKSFHSKVGAKLKLMQYRPQEYIIKEGDPSKSMYWILKGTVSVTSTDGESIHAELASGSFFGEIGILFNRPRTATVVARTRVLVGVLTSDALNTVLKSYPLIERRIRDEAQERLAMQEKKNKADLPIFKPSSAFTLSSAAKMSLVQPPDQASTLANLVAPVPGPAIPPLINPSPLSQSITARTPNLSHPNTPDVSDESNATPSDNVDQSISIQDFIKNLPIFHNLPSHIIHRLALGVEPLYFNPFENIFLKNDPGSDIYFVVSGEVEVVDCFQNKKIETVLARLKPGSYFGEMTFLSLLNGKKNCKRSATIRSVTSVELIVVRSDKLESLCNQYPFIVDDMRNTANQRNSLNSLNNPDLSLSFSPSPSGSLPPSRRLSINSLVDTASLDEVKTQPPLFASQSQGSIFSPNWGFNQKKNESGKLSRSVSPVSVVDSELSKLTNTTSLTSVDDELSRKRKSISHGPPIITQSQLLNIVVPPLNPIVPSINNFQNFQPGSRRSSFQYMPHNKRVRLASLSGGRRRSSVLSNNGPLPDTILLKVFEYFSLPELMKLRAVNRRWRQLLYVAPNLLRKLDLRPWNTSIDDKALISITDFAGSRPQYIDISNCFHITDEGFTYMVNEIGISGQIKVLKMKSNWEVSAMAIMDLTVPSVGQYLEEIDLSNCRKVRDNVLERLVGWGVDETGKITRTGESFNNAVGCKNLKLLSVGYCKHLTDDIMYHIANHASLRLESLDLTRCTTITDKGFQYWTYKSFPNLKRLSLKDCTFLTDKSIISIANAAGNLEFLDLNFCCALSDIAIEVLCLGCPKLQELDLSFCGSAVSDSSLVAISLHLRHLQRLILKGCIRVTRAGIDALLSGCSPLNYINVSQCKNAHIYPGGIPAQKLNVNAETKSAFVTAGPFQNIIEIVI